MYTVTVVNINSREEISKEEFETAKEAKKCKRSLMKKYTMINHGGYFVNYSEGVELLTNF